MKTILANEEEIRNIFHDELIKFLGNIPTVKSDRPTVIKITSIKQGANFLDVSDPTFQRLKNSGNVRFYSTGRKFIMYSNELLEDLAAIRAKKR